MTTLQASACDLVRLRYFLKVYPPPAHAFLQFHRMYGAVKGDQDKVHLLRSEGGALTVVWVGARVELPVEAFLQVAGESK